MLKYNSELSFWKNRFESEKEIFKNSHYRKLMLAMAGEANERFLDGKIVADFGCGPRGSLAWAASALARIGIDVLADAYKDKLISNRKPRPRQYTLFAIF